MANSRVCSIPNCGKRSKYRGMCERHYRRYLRYGDPLSGKTPAGEPHQFLTTIALRHAGTECLLWPYARSSGGYGQIRIHGRMQPAHRVICELVNGAPPDPDYEAAHSCGQGHNGCVSPLHLSWKTSKQNMADRIGHGTAPRGTRHYKAKLSDQDVLRICSLYGDLDQHQIGKMFGISNLTVSCIIRGRAWGWLTNRSP